MWMTTTTIVINKHNVKSLANECPRDILLFVATYKHGSGHDRNTWSLLYYIYIYILFIIN